MNRIEVTLFDVDGVVIKPRQKFFSDRLVEELGVSEEEAMSFVHGLLIPSMTGKVDLKREFPALLKR